MGRRSKKSLRAIRLSQIRWQKRRNATSAACGGDGEEAVAMETEPTPIEDGELSEIEEEEEEEEEEEVSVSASTKDDTIATRVRQKKRLNLDKVVEAMKKRKTSGDSNLLCPDQISHNGLNDEQLDNIGTFLNKQTSVIQQHMQQNDIDASERDQNNAENNQTDPLTSLQIYNEMKKLYGANLKYTLVRDTLISEMMTGSRALSSLPWQLLVGQSEACGGELGVFSKVYIKANTVFEPMAGPTFLPEDVTKEMNPRFLWPLFDDCKVSQYIDVSNEGSASWLRYMNPAPKLAMQNIEVRLVKNTLFFVTIRHIKPGSELLFWFSHPYCKLQYLPNDPEKATMRIECDKCQLQFSSPLYTHRHITAFHPYGLKTDKYTCYMCKEAVYGRKKLTNHMQDQHGTRAAWQCDLCGKAVHSRSYLKEHKRKVHLPEEKAKKYPCEQCGRMFKCRAHLRRHVECVHDRNFNLECEYCCKKFSSKKYLDKHLKAHKGEFPFVCDKCSKGFFDSHSLKVHLLTHSGVRPYKCTLCDTATSTKQLLQFHFKKSHGFTKENMPEIKRQMELTFDSSPVTGYKERDKPPRQRIFRTRPVDKSGTQETHETAPGEESCRTDENITAADTLLQQKYNNGPGNSERVPESDSRNNQQASSNVLISGVSNPFSSSVSVNVTDTVCDTEQTSSTVQVAPTQRMLSTEVTTVDSRCAMSETPVRPVYTNRNDNIHQTVPVVSERLQPNQTSTAQRLPQPSVPTTPNYNLLPSDYYGSTVSNYHSDSQTENHGLPSIPGQNAVTFPPTYATTGVPYTSGQPQLATHTMPTSNFIPTQVPWH